MARKKSLVRDIARQRSLILYSLAVSSAREGKLNRARMYIERGIEVLLKAKARKPIVYRRWVCERCYTPLIPGVTARVRIRGTRSYVVVVKKCLACGWINRSAADRKEEE